MSRFLGLVVLLFALFVAAWTWFTGDMRPFQVAYWKNMMTSSLATATPPTAVPAGDSNAAPDSMASMVAKIGSPAGRYVMAKLGTAPTAAVEPVADVMRVESPTGRYVDAPAMAAPEATPMKIAQISSPAGRYVDAPAAKAAAPMRKIARISSPSGRYVDGPAVKTTAPPRNIARIGSPSGRYVDGPAVKKAEPQRKIARIGSPSGRYVDGPAVKTTAPPRKITRVSSPSGRYVDGPKVAAAAPTTAPVAFPITFEYRKSTFTTDGRKAADNLLSYITERNYSDVTLTGHTDSRGSQEVNMAISKNRLDTVAAHLRAGGYKGDLSLVPKGKSEPFSGVDRSKLSEEQLWDLDRRVELAKGS